MLPCRALQSDKTKALFQVAVSFEPHGMAFSPTETAILDEINANALEGIASVAQVSWPPVLALHCHVATLASLQMCVTAPACVAYTV